jgi:hypothetical protein
MRGRLKYGVPSMPDDEARHDCLDSPLSRAIDSVRH